MQTPTPPERPSDLPRMMKYLRPICDELRIDINALAELHIMNGQVIIREYVPAENGGFQFVGDVPILRDRYIQVDTETEGG